MAKFNINIEKANKYNEFETIVEININNGNWKYWDDYMESDDKISLTINNIGEAYYLTQPVKEAVGMYDIELLKQNKAKVVGANINTFNTLIEFINYRLNNVKEDVKSNIYDIVFAKKGGRTFNAVLLDQPTFTSKDIVEDITYSDATEIRMTIKLVE